MKRLFSISCRSNNFTNKTRFQEHIVSTIVMNRDIISLKINIIGFKFLRHLEKYKRSEKKTHFLLRLICLFFPFFSWWAGYLRGKLERPLTSSRVNHWEITLYWSFFKLLKDMREKSREKMVMKSLFFFLKDMK